jgi:restriction system protein
MQTWLADSSIDLVDGDKLVELFEQKKLGLKEKVVYEVDRSFFDEYC